MSNSNDKIKLNCFDIGRFCDKAEYGEISEQELQALERHLPKCPICRQYLYNTQELTELLQCCKDNMLNREERVKLKDKIKKALQKLEG